MHEHVEWYRTQAICTGCSGTVEHIDWSYAVVDGPIHLHGRYILQSNDTSRDVLHWDGLTGKKITSNQRDCMWSTFTCTLGFPVLGIWPDFSDGMGAAIQTAITCASAVCWSSSSRDLPCSPGFNRAEYKTVVQAPIVPLLQSC